MRVQPIKPICTALRLPRKKQVYVPKKNKVIKKSLRVDVVI